MPRRLSSATLLRKVGVSRCCTWDSAMPCLGGLFGVGLEFKLLSWYILYSGVGLRRLPDCLGPTSG